LRFGAWREKTSDISFWDAEAFDHTRGHLTAPAQQGDESPRRLAYDDLTAAFTGHITNERVAMIGRERDEKRVEDDGWIPAIDVVEYQLAPVTHESARIVGSARSNAAEDGERGACDQSDQNGMTGTRTRMRLPAADFRTHFGFRRRRDPIATFVVRTVP
jgi:hypothetical protein